MCFPYRRSPSALRLGEPTATAERGTTLGLRIDKYRTLIMSRALCAASQQHGAVACTTVNLDARFARRLAARSYVFEVAHTVYKNASNRL